MSRWRRTGYLLGITLFYLTFNPKIDLCSRGRFSSFGFTFGIRVYAQEQNTQKQQTQEFYPLESTPEEGVDPLEGPLHPLLREEISVEGQALEGAVDPETYRMGPGDLVAVCVFGDIEDKIVARVAADGLLTLRTLGVFNTNGKVFAAIQKEVLAAAKTRYQSQKIDVSLIELRNFKASVGGMVWAPGTYNMTAADRVVTLLSRAGGFYNPARRKEAELTQVQQVIERQKKKGSQIPELPSYSARRAQVFHRDGTQENVDLLLFLRAGRYDGNPYLRDGDFLLIPPLNPESGVLGIYGAVNHQGRVEYLKGDNLETAILLAGGLMLDAERDSIEIARFTGEGAAYRTFYVNLDDPGAWEIPLYPDDRIYIRSIPDYHPRHQVELRGEFVKPGFYPVGEKGTPLIQIIEEAGGFTPRASLKEATLTRKMGIELVDPEYERLRLTPVSEMKPLEYQYYKTKTRELSGQVVMDLYALVAEGDSTNNVLLRDGDILEVPPITEAVKVTGQVKHPGIVTLKPGEPYTYYIEKCGGFAWNSRKSKIRVIKAISGKWVKPQSTTINEGDTIFVPGKSEVDYWQLYKDIMLVVTQFATLYLVFITASR